MNNSRSAPVNKLKLLRASCVAALMLAAAGCATDHPLTTGSIPASDTQLSHMNRAQLEALTKRIGAQYAAHPKDRNTGLNYATLLRMTGQNDQALAVMQQVAIYHPSDRMVLAAYGKAQAAAGQLNQALSTIQRAQTPDHPDWRLLSAQGAILDQLGRPDEARDLYRKALMINPNAPSVLSNLGMSYVLTGDLRTAESYLRKAAAQPDADGRIRQNLALVVGLQGRFAEAEKIASADLPPAEAQANVQYLRQMLSQQNSWSKLASGNRKKKQVAAD